MWSGAGAAGAHVGGGVQGITFHLLSVLALPDAVKGMWDVIAYQHSHHHWTESPITAAWGYGLLAIVAKCIGLFAGTKRPTRYPVHSDIVVAVLLSRLQALTELWDGLALVVASMGGSAAGV